MKSMIGHTHSFKTMSLLWSGLLLWKKSLWVNDLRFSRHMDRLFVDMDWSEKGVGEYLIIEAYRVIDYDTYTQVWGDYWLRGYTTQLFKRQWGENLKKFEGMQQQLV